MIREKIDIVFNVLHGTYGEDGAVQGLLEVMSIPYTGSGILGSAIGMNKRVTKKILQESGVPVPASVDLNPDSPEECIRAIEKTIGFPAVLKPNAEGSSIGIKLVKTPQELTECLAEYRDKFRDCFAEQYIRGREITVGAIGSRKGLKILPILELKPKNEFYDFEAKYTKGMTLMEIPAKIRSEKVELIHSIMRKSFAVLNISGVARIDMMLNADENPFVLEANTIPGMTDTSDIPAMAEAAGMSFEDAVLLILESIEK